MRFPTRSAALLMLALPGLLAAQTLTESYIELTVTDTLPMSIKNIVYEVTPADEAAADVVYDDNTDYDKVQREAAERGRKLKERLEKDLKAQGYTLADAAPTYGDPYTINSYEGEAEGTAAAVRVSVKSEAELKKLVAWLRGRGKLDGHIVEWNYDNASDPGSALIAALFKQAQKRADQLATLGGRKLGKLLLVRDPQQKELTFQDFIRMMDERDRGNGDLDRMVRARMRSMTFRFAFAD